MTKQRTNTADVIRSEITDYADSLQNELYEQLTLFSEDSEEYAKTQNLCQAVQKAKQEIGVSILPEQECAILDENPNKAGAVLSAAYQQFLDMLYDNEKYANNVIPPTQFLALHGAVTDNLSEAHKYVLAEVNKRKKQIVTDDKRVEITLFGSGLQKIPTSVSKLLIRAITELAKKNHTGRNAKLPEAEDKCKVEIPIAEFAKQRFSEHKKEKDLIDNARKSFKKESEILYHINIRVIGEKNYENNMRILSQYGTDKRGNITMTFTPEMAQYLIRQVPTYYPVALYATDDRCPNAYSLGVAICNYANMDSNIIRRKNNRLAVKTLLSHTALPKYGEGVKLKRHLKDPLENALNALVECGVLNEWHYDAYKEKFVNYKEWSETLVYFSLKDPVDHNERIDKKLKAKAEREQNYAVAVEMAKLKYAEKKAANKAQ